jgi:hypothetical protein
LLLRGGSESGSEEWCKDCECQKCWASSDMHRGRFLLYET